MKIIFIALLLCIPACEVHHYHEEDPYVYETVYVEPSPIVYTEYVEVEDYYTNYEQYDCWGTVTPFQWSKQQLIYCDEHTCCTWEDYNCEVTYCYEPDSCGWAYTEEVCYY